MRELKLGVAPIAWTNDDLHQLGGETPLESCLHDMQRIGYAGTELGNKFPKNGIQIKNKLQEYKLVLASSWHSTFFISSDFEVEALRLREKLQQLKEAGAERINICECTDTVHGSIEIPLSKRPLMNESSWERFTNDLNKAGEICSEFGISLCYHHHLGTVVQTEEEITRLMDNTDPQHVFLCYDSGHLTAAGVDPLKIWNKYHSRIKHVHLKDVRKNILQLSQEKNLSFLNSVLEGLFTVPSDGMIDFKTLLKEILESSYSGWLLVEAEQDPAKADPYLYAKKAYDFLQENISLNEMSPLKKSIQLGVEFWNDSCDLEHLSEAIDNGAVGATCNPVIVYNAITRQKDLWSTVVKNFIEENPFQTEQELAWKLVKYSGKKASELLLPIYEKTEGRKGKISLQVNPYAYNSYELMLKQGMELSELAPNITVKVPATDVGIKVMEELSAQGISVNATVSFSVAQAKESAEAIERGLEKARRSGKLSASHSSYVTIMVGRVEDFIRNEVQKLGISINPVSQLWSGVAVFKEAHRLFQKHSYKATLLSAAYRHSLHWSELIGEGVVLSIPYEWWKRFNRSKEILKTTLNNPVEKHILTELYQVPSFETLMNFEVLKREDYVNMTPSKNTLVQFLNGQDDLIKWLRTQMIV